MAIPIAAAAFFFKRVGATNAGATIIRSVGGSRSSSTSIRLFVDGSFNTSTATADTGSVPAGLWAHGCLLASSVTASDFSAMKEYVSTVGASLSDSQQLSLYNSSVTFCSSLGRT